MTKLGIAPIAPAPLTTESLAAMAADLIKANTEIDRWKQYKDAITTRMSELHENGLVPTKFEAHGYSVALQNGRSTVQLDDAGKEQSKALQAFLIEEGHGTTVVGNPFWVARPAKPSKS